MPTCLAAGINTYYQRIGQGRPVVLLLHGWGNDWTSWSGLVPLLAEHFTVLIPDLPGFGQSRPVGGKGWSMADYTHWLQEFLRDQQVDSLVAVLGHSFGGKLALFTWLGTAASSVPAPTKGLWLLGSSGIGRPLSWPRWLGQQLLSLLPRSLKRQWLARVRNWYYRQVLHEVDYWQADPFQEATLRHILNEDIRQVATAQSSLPLYLAWGERDTAVPLWMAYEISKLSQSATVLMVPGAGHHVHHDAPTVIKHWLQTTLVGEAAV